MLSASSCSSRYLSSTCQTLLSCTDTCAPPRLRAIVLLRAAQGAASGYSRVVQTSERHYSSLVRRNNNIISRSAGAVSSGTYYTPLVLGAPIRQQSSSQASTAAAEVEANPCTTSSALSETASMSRQAILNGRRSSSVGSKSQETDYFDDMEDGEGSNSLAAALSALTRTELSRIVAARLELPLHSAQYIIDQTKSGSTVPFLARYRQDESGHLDETQIRSVIATAEEVTEVHRRRSFMLKSLEQRGLLTPQLKAAFDKMVHVSQLEDAWEPYKVRKTSLAQRGRDAGLGPVVEALLHKTDPLPNMRQLVDRVEDGERLFIAIICEELTRSESMRLAVLKYMQDTGRLVASVVKSARKKQAKEMSEAEFEKLQKKFEFYDQKSWPVRMISSHIVLALQRGETKGVLKVDVTQPQTCERIVYAHAKTNFCGLDMRLDNKNNYSKAEMFFLHKGIAAAHEHIVKAATLTIRRDLRKSAEREAIHVFAHNLRHMLLQRPMSHARVLAMDPGISNGVKCVALDETGAVLSFFKCTLMDEHRMVTFVTKIVEELKLNKIVIGNGTASQQTAHLIAKIIEKNNKLVQQQGNKQHKSGVNVTHTEKNANSAPQSLSKIWSTIEFAVVSEAGASVYSVSDAAKEEFPTLDIMYRGAVSIGRRVLDPLSELVKIPVKSMGIGMYQHDVNEKELTIELNHVVESCVALVGVNASGANRYVLEKVPGIHSKVVDQIVLSRHTRKLNSREDLRRVPGMTEAVYQQIAGFLRFPNSAEALDNSCIHPESYHLARQLFRLYEDGQLGWCAGADGSSGAARHIGNTQHRQQVGLAVSSLPADALLDVAKKLKCGTETLKLVGKELLTPALDPRASLRHAGLLRREIKHVSSLKPGDVLEGVVQSVTTFGAFVDCGLHDAVLVRGQGVDNLRVGEILPGIVFQSLDKLKRPRVVCNSLSEGGRAGAGMQLRGLQLEANDAMTLGGDDQSAAAGAGAGTGLKAHLARVRQRDNAADSDYIERRSHDDESDNGTANSNNNSVHNNHSNRASPEVTTVSDDEDDIPLAKRFRTEERSAVSGAPPPPSSSRTITIVDEPSLMSIPSKSPESSSSSSPEGDGDLEDKEVVSIGSDSDADSVVHMLTVKKKKNAKGTRSNSNANSTKKKTATATKKAAAVPIKKTTAAKKKAIVVEDEETEYFSF